MPDTFDFFCCLHETWRLLNGDIRIVENFASPQIIFYLSAESISDLRAKAGA